MNTEKILNILYNNIFEVAYSALMKKKCKSLFSEFPIQFEYKYGNSRQSLTKVINTVGRNLIFIQNLSEYGTLNETGIYENQDRYADNARKCIDSNSVVDIKYLTEAYRILWYSTSDSDISYDENLQILRECVNRGSEESIDSAVRTVVNTAIQPKNILMFHLYSRYHKLFDFELYEASYHILHSKVSSGNESFSLLCSNVINSLSQFARTIYSDIYKNIADDVAAFARIVYKDFWGTADIFTSIKAYAPPDEKVLSAVESILNTKQLGNPDGHTNGKIYRSDIEKYMSRLINIVKKQLIVKLETSYLKVNPNTPNLRTIRRKSPELTKAVGLEIQDGQLKYQNLEITSCPDFLIDRLWNLCKQHGVKGYSKEKLNAYAEIGINLNHIRLLGELYIVIFLIYSFDSRNYTDPYSDANLDILSIVNQSLSKLETRILLTAYYQITDSIDEKEIIENIFDKWKNNTGQPLS